MTTCPHCGASGEAYAPCPKCGELVEPGGGVQVDAAAANRHLQAGTGDRPTDAQIGGAGGTGPLQAERVAPPRSTVHKATLEDAQREIARDDERRRALWWRVTHVPAWCVLGFFTLSYLTMDSMWLVVDHLDDLVHAGGHATFNWGGDGQRALGGTIGQVLVPSVLAAYLYYRESERFWAVAALWWLGQNLTHIAAYIRDADKTLRDPIAGDVHSWNFLLERWEKLDSAQSIAGTVDTAGIVVMAVSLLVLGALALRPDRFELVP